MLPSSVVEAVETVLKSQDGVMKKWGQVQEILLGAKLAYQQVFPPCLFMVHPLNHPLNPGGTGVNPYSCHRKGGAIVAAGADLQQLGGAVAFELSMLWKHKCNNLSSPYICTNLPTAVA